MIQYGYDTAEVCENGHVVTDALHNSPDLHSEYCATCGASTIHLCQNCNADIRGHYFLPGVTSYRGYNKPSFCHACGTPYPWTGWALDTLRELTQELDGLSEDEKQQLARSFNDLVTDTPKTDIAVYRLKRLLPRVGDEAWSTMKSILINVATEAAKKQMGL